MFEPYLGNGAGTPLWSARGGAGATPAHVTAAFSRDGMAELDELRAENALLRRQIDDLQQSLADKPVVGRAALFSLIDAMPMLVGVIEPSGAAGFLSRAFERWLIAGADETLPLLERLVPALRAPVAPLLAPALAGQAQGVSLTLADRDGESRDLSLSVIPRLDADGTVNGVILVGQDNTDRRRADEALSGSERRLRLATHAAGLGIWDWNLVTGDIQYSEHAKAICGFPPGRPVTIEQIRALTHRDDHPITSAMAERATDPAIREQLPFEYRLRLPNGAIRWVLAHGEAVFATEGDSVKAVRYVGTLQDITGRKAVEEALAESEARLRLIVEGEGVGAFDTDMATGEAVWSASTFEMMGLRPTPDGRAGPSIWESRLHPADVQHVLAARAAAQAGGDWKTTYRILRGDTGETRWITTYGRIIPRPGMAPRSVGMIVDVTDEKLAEARQRLLLNELNHRVKNTLAAVQSIARSTLRGQVGSEAATNLFTSRLMALSSAHDVLTRETWEGAGLREIVAGAVRAYEDDGGGRFQIEGEDVRIAPKAAVALAMALHELATNAAKYGALTVETGRVILRWEARGVGEARRLELEWREVGGPAVTPPGRGGFGSRLLRQGLKSELGASAQMRFEPTGLICVIQAPLVSEQALEPV
ncbi:MAG: histidine kinase [Caulobacter sp.]|nr:histidine kinase [Caulobacter sp.]